MFGLLFDDKLSELLGEVCDKIWEEVVMVWPVADEDEILLL